MAELLVYNPETEYIATYDKLMQVHPSVVFGERSATGAPFDIDKSEGLQYKLTSAKFYIRKSGNPVGIVKAYLYIAKISTNPDYRIPDGVSIAESDGMAIEDITTTMTLTEFKFYGSNQYIMDSRTWYVIILQVESASLIDGSNYIRVALDTTDVNHYHNNTSYHNGAWGWDTVKDGVFYVYGEFYCSTTGQFNSTKNCLKDALTSIITEASVTGNWRDINKLIFRTKNLPVISVRFSNERVWGPYDTPVISEMEAGYRFTLFIFHSNCMESGYDKAHYAYHLADRIKTGLFPNPPVIGWDLEMLSCREIEPAGGAHRISRVVIIGRINIQRID